MNWTWLLFGVVVAGGATVFLVAFRSFRRWSQPRPGQDPRSQQAEARLWSTLNTNRR